MIVTVTYYPHGYTGALDEKFNQSRDESEPWYVTVVRDLMRKGLVDDSTTINVPANYAGPVSHLRGMHHLPTPSTPPSYFSVFFFPDGRTVATDLVGQQHELEKWYITALRDKSARGAVAENARVIVPNVFCGPASDLVTFPSS
jgi:hypothetical protein